MRSLILREPGRVDLIDVAIPVPGPGEVLVRTEFTGICRTDRKCFAAGQRDLRLPRVLGHEIVGVIAAIGPALDGTAGGHIPPPVGTRVAVHPGIPCTKCADCRAGLDQVCLDMQIFGFHVDGGFAEYTLIPAAGVAAGVLNPLPAGLPPQLGVLTEPLACAINLAERLAFVPGDSLVLIGAGVLGTLFATLARLSGVSHIVVLDIDTAKVTAARAAGFTAHHVSATDAELLSGQPGFSVAIATCPGTDALERCTSLLARRGRLGIFSGLTAGRPIAAAMIDTIHYRELAAFGSYGCGLNHTRAALALLQQHSDAYGFPTRFIALDEVADVLADPDIATMTTIDLRSDR